MPILNFVAKINDIDVSSRCLFNISIVTGRADIESQPDASVCNLTLFGLGYEQVGQPLVITANGYQIFGGIVTDLNAQQDSEMKWETAVVATGPLRSLGQHSAGIAGWPLESDSSRIARILDEIGMPHSINPNAAGWSLLATPEGERVNAGEAARKAADDGLGVLWEDPSDSLGRVKYLPANLRVWDTYQYLWKELENAWSSYTGNWNSLNSDDTSGNTDYPGEITIDPSSANAEAVFEQSIGDLAKTVIVQWGVAPIDPEGNEGERPEIIAGEGEEPQETFETDLAIEEEATQFATTMVKRKQNPAWRLTQLIIHAELLSQTQWIEFREKLSVGLRLTIPFPNNSPVGMQWQGYCEGWEHQIVGEKFRKRRLEVSHSIILNVSDRQLTEPGNRWFDYPIDSSWNDIVGTWIFQ